MRPDIAEMVRGADLTGWRPLEVEYGSGSIEVRVPPACVTLEMREVPPLADPEGAIREALHRPIGSPPLPEILRRKAKPVGAISVCITTSDITRPVPYRGRAGILPPLLATLREAGLRPEQIVLLVGTGTHRASTREEKLAMFGEEVVSGYRIVDHACDNEAMLVDIGRTSAGTEIRINRLFVEADVKIATGLVESHFMAGVSAGRKAICPALVSWKTIERFHSAEYLDSPRATNLVLEGNPCHEEAQEIARRAGVDFCISAVLNRRLQFLGVFAGELEASHRRAVELVREFAAISVPEPFDIVLTHGGYVGINHYQNAKAAVNALPIVKPGGFVILAACERDADPVGPTTYRTLLHLLKLQGPDGYLATLRQPGWRFTRDQWEPQMWGKLLKKVGEAGLIYCSALLPEGEREIVPGEVGWDYLPEGEFADDAARIAAMLQQAIVYAVRLPRWRQEAPRMAFIREGPYAVPVLGPAASCPAPATGGNELTDSRILRAV
ncbi:MAG: nickel-dependent lactate racemase [candidate division NC10 bacterium]|nr:nickel-dependent lactate racemase [candidate division NC10 bacterium]